jgi:hypothetical protein
MISTGMSQEINSIAAGENAAREAMKTYLSNTSPGWALAFSSGKHNPDQFIRGIHNITGNIPVYGGASLGTITNNQSGYTGYETGLVIFNKEIPEPIAIIEKMSDDIEINIGQKLGKKIKSLVNKNDSILLFYDSVKQTDPFKLYIGSNILKGIYQELPDNYVNLIGAGLLKDFQFTGGYIFDGQKALTHAISILILPSQLHTNTIIMHGCTPVSSFLEITKIDGPVLYELDGKPALEVIKSIMGLDETNSVDHKTHITLFATLGENHGDLFEPYDESHYVNRLIVDIDENKKSVTLFEADFAAGSKVQIMSRDNQLMCTSVVKQTRKLLNNLKGKKPLFGLYINCAGRTSAVTGSDYEEASVLQKEIGQNFPLLGFYSGVEIAPFLGRSRPLDWTGVLTLFTMENKS